MYIESSTFKIHSCLMWLS